MPTILINLDVTQYVQVNTGRNPLLLQAKRDTVRITLSELKPSKSNTVFHILSGGDESLSIPSPDTNVWALGLTEQSSLVVSETDIIDVSPQVQKTAFGEQLTATLTPIIQEEFSYNINPETWDLRLNGGTAIVDQHRLSVSTGVGANQSALVLSRTPIKYSAGVGGLVRFSGVFTLGVVGQTQLIFIGDIADGFAFGYSGIDFGVFRIAYGHPEFQTLTINTASTTAENITVTLDGVASSVPVTNNADLTITANEIAAFDYSNVGEGWKSHSMGNTVIFENFRARPRSGSYSLSATTTVGTFVRTLGGVVPTTDFIAQSDWNRNKMTGLDQTKGNIYQIRYQWLGFGPIKFYIEDEMTGEFVNVHNIEYTNKNTLPSINNPTLPVGYFVENTTNTTDINIKSGSIAGFIEGENAPSGVKHAVSSGTKVIPAATEVPLLTLHSPVLYVGVPNRVTLKNNFIQVVVDGNKSAIIRIYRNVILVGSSFVNVDSSSSTASFDVAAVSFSEGDLLYGTVLDKSGSVSIDLSGFNFTIRPNEFLTITVESANSTEALAAINYEDEF